MPEPEILRFGAFCLRPRRRELLLRGEAVTLGSRAFDLLTALVERRGQLVTKSELMAVVWAGTVVEENNLAAQVSTLRKVLSGDPALSNALQTVPARGYRFVADVDAETGTGAGTGTGTGAGTGGDTAPQVGAVGGSGEEAPSLVVMPFTSLSSGVEQMYFAQGLSHTVATDLSRISGLLVISSATAATYEGRNLDARQVSRELAVRYVLTGNVQRNEQHVRVNAQLVDGHTGLQIWAERFDGDDSDLFALQDWITGRIANSTSREVFVAAARSAEARRVDPKSWDLVMRGIAADNRPQSLHSLREQEALFAQATELDPDNVEALARHARAILLQLTQVHASSVRDEQMVARGVAAAERAVGLDPGNARAHYAIGLVHVLRGDFERAVLANETAIMLDRNFALAHNNLGNSFVHLGKGDEALDAAQKALRLDPRGSQVGAIWTTQGFAHLLRGDIDNACEAFARGRAANPRLPRALVGAAVSLALRGELIAARRASEELLKLVPGYRLSQTMDASLPTSTAVYERFYEDVLRRGASLGGVPL